MQFSFIAWIYVFTGLKCAVTDWLLYPLVVGTKFVKHRQDQLSIMMYWSGHSDNTGKLYQSMMSLWYVQRAIEDVIMWITLQCVWVLDILLN
jgi:hypothetical protein